MKKFDKKLIAVFIQLIIFYILPLFRDSYNAMGMVLIMVIATFVLSISVGCLSNQKIKYLYPIIISVLFIPSVMIYYNESALVHSLWYLTDSFTGIILGASINKIIKTV